MRAPKPVPQADEKGVTSGLQRAIKAGPTKNTHTNRDPMQLQLQTLLNLVHPLKSFVYADIRLLPRAGPQGATIEVRVQPRKNGRGRCVDCNRPGPTYDHQPERRFDFVPFWGLLVFLLSFICEKYGLELRRRQSATAEAPESTRS